MMKEVTLRQYGGSLGTTLPKAMTDRLHLTAGDKLYAIETEQGILLIPFNSELARVLEMEEQLSQRYQNALYALAK